MKHLFFPIAVCLFMMHTICPAQTVEKGWQEYSISGICSFSIPPTLELRDDGSYMGLLKSTFDNSDYMNQMREELDCESTSYSCVFQPVGMNENFDSEKLKNASKVYARILISVENEDEITENDIKTLTQTDIDDLNGIYQNEIEHGFEKMLQASPFICTGQFKWIPLRRKFIGGKYCLVIEFYRPGNKGETHVTQYRFYVKGKYIEVTLSYKESERNRWKNDFDKFPNTIHF